MVTSSVLFILTSILAQSAQSQSHEPLTILEATRIQAKQDSEVLDPILKKETANLSPSYDTCIRRAISSKKRYHDWFLEFEPEFFQVSKKFDDMVAALKRKIPEVKDDPIETNAAESFDPNLSKKRDKEITFEVLLNYFPIYNARALDPKPNLEEFKKEMNRPESNPLGVAHSEILAALERMTINLNSSLRSEGHTFHVVTVPKGNQLDLVIRTFFGGDPKTQKPFDISLLELSVLDSFSEEKKWRWLTASDLKIEKYSIDGIARYSEFINEERGTCPVGFRLPSESIGLPHVSQSKIDEMIKELNLNGVGLSTSSFIWIEAGKFEVQATEVTQQEWYDQMRTVTSFFSKKKYCPDTFVTIPGSKQGYCPTHPVESISIFEVNEFIESVNQADPDFIYGLPTDGEWGIVYNSRKIKPPFPLNPVGTTPVRTGTSDDVGLFYFEGNVSEFVIPSSKVLGPGVYVGGNWKSWTRSTSLSPLDRASNTVGFRLIRKRKSK